MDLLFQRVFGGAWVHMNRFIIVVVVALPPISGGLPSIAYILGHCLVNDPQFIISS